MAGPKRSVGVDDSSVSRYVRPRQAVRSGQPGGTLPRRRPGDHRRASQRTQQRRCTTEQHMATLRPRTRRAAVTRRFKRPTDEVAVPTCTPASSQTIARLIVPNTSTDEPAPSLHPHCRGFPATTSRSARGAATVLNASRFLPFGALPLAPQTTHGPDSGIDVRVPTFHAEAADRTRAASTPDTTWPIDGHPPGSSRALLTAPVSMSSTCFDASSTVRSRSPSRSPPDASPAPFPQRSPRRSSANAA